VVVELWRRNRAKLRVVPRPYLRITRDVCRRADGGRRQGFELFRTAERHRHGSINADADPHPVTDRESGAGSDRAYPVHEPDGFGRRERLDNGAVPFAALLDWHPPTGGHRPRPWRFVPRAWCRQYLAADRQRHGDGGSGKQGDKGGQHAAVRLQRCEGVWPLARVAFSREELAN